MEGDKQPSDRDPAPWLEHAVLAAALVLLVLGAAGGPSWGSSSALAVLAGRMDHFASAPLYDVLAGAAALIPAGEPGFRLALLDAVLGALALAGVIAAVRALLPRDPGAGLVAVLLLLVAPPFRDAAAFAAPSILAACGIAWAIACALRYIQRRHARDVACAIAACLLVVGSAPWLGALLTIAIAGWLARAGAPRDLLAICIGVLGVFVVVLWIGATGSLPGLHGSLTTALAATGRGAAAIVVGAGLLGAGFGALTRLPHATWLAALITITGAHEIVVGGNAVALLVLLAIAAAIVPSAIVRATMPKLEGSRRQALAVLAGLPLVGVAAATGATLTVEDPGATPAQLAHDLTSELPPGPGVFVATRQASWLALQYEAAFGGARTDLVLVPPLPPEQADAIVANALRGERIVGADASAFGRLDVRRAIPRHRGFQLVGDIPADPAPIVAPARYPTRVGREQAVWLAVERARHEAASARLGAAARALGLEERFGAADLAVLAATLPSKERPALFGFLPLDDRPAGEWIYDVFGDDLAWVAGIEVPPVDEHAPLARRLHAKWRAILLGKATPEDPEIAAMGPRAVQATRELFERAGSRD